jgi:type I restriction enzyme M protein
MRSSLTGSYEQTFRWDQYGRIILPFTLLRRLECVFSEHKADVLAELERVEAMGLPEEAKEKLLLRASKLSFYNTSKMDLASLGASGIKENLDIPLLLQNPKVLVGYDAEVV